MDLNVGIKSRIDNFNLIRNKLEPIPTKACYIDESTSKIVGNFLNLHYFVDVKGELGRGTYNQAKEICVIEIDETTGERKCIGDSLVMKLPLPGESENSKAWRNNYYSYMLTKFVTQRIIPNFLMTFNTYICSTENIIYPINIQERADSDLLEFSTNLKYDDTEVSSLIAQTLLTLQYMNNKLKISHADAKPNNVLIKHVGPSNLTYKLGSEEVKLESKYIALISDYDLTVRNDMNIDNLGDLSEDIALMAYVLGVEHVDMTNLNEFTNRLLQAQENLEEFLSELKFEEDANVSSKKHYMKMILDIYKNTLIFDTDTIQHKRRKICNYDLVCFSFKFFNVCFSSRSMLVLDLLDLIYEHVVNKQDLINCINSHFNQYFRQNQSDTININLNLTLRFNPFFRNNLDLAKFIFAYDVFANQFIEKETIFKLVGEPISQRDFTNQIYTPPYFAGVNYDEESDDEENNDESERLRDVRDDTIDWLIHELTETLSIDNLLTRERIYNIVRLFDLFLSNIEELFHGSYEEKIFNFNMCLIVCLQMIYPYNIRSVLIVLFNKKMSNAHATDEHIKYRRLLGKNLTYKPIKVDIFDQWYYHMLDQLFK